MRSVFGGRMGGWAEWPSISRLERQTEIPFGFCVNYRNGIIRRGRWFNGL